MQAIRFTEPPLGQEFYNVTGRPGLRGGAILRAGRT